MQEMEYLGYTISGGKFSVSTKKVDAVTSASEELVVHVPRLWYMYNRKWSFLEPPNRPLIEAIFTEIGPKRAEGPNHSIFQEILVTGRGYSPWRRFCPHLPPAVAPLGTSG
jgi:hypothetical protein